MTHSYKIHKIEVKIYDGFRGAKKITLDDIISLDTTKNAVESSDGTLKIAKIPNISVLDRIEIFAILKDREEKIFEGYIREISADLYFLHLSLADFKSILERKIVFNEIKNYKNGKAFIAKILDEWRRMTGEYLVVDMDDDTEGKYEASPGESIYSVLQNVAKEDYMIDFDISLETIKLKKVLGKKHAGLYTYSLYHADNRILDVSTTITEAVATRYYLTEKKTLSGVSTVDESKYGVLVSTSDNDKKTGFGVDRNFDIKIADYSLSVGDAITLEIIGNNYRDAVVDSGWSTSSDGFVAGDYLSYYGEAFVLSENITVSGGFIAKTVEIGTKVKRKKTLTDLLLMKIR